MDLYPVFHYIKSGDHDMKTKNKQNPGNKQNWLLASFAYCLD